MIMSTVASTPRNSPLDPDIYDWCSRSRIEQLESELGPALRLLLWSHQLPSLINSWVRRILVTEYLQNNCKWSESTKNKFLDEAHKTWASNHEEGIVPGCQEADLSAWYLQEKILLSWSMEHWEHRLESIYLERKQELDFVSCSLLRVTDQYLAFELSQRLKSKESSFEQLSWQYGKGPERNQGGRFIRTRVANLPKPLQPLLRKLKPGEVLKPHRLGKWFVIMTLEELIPAQFDEETRSYLLLLELEIWLNEVSNYLASQLKS